MFAMVLCVISIWMISVERYFNTRDMSSHGPVYQLVILVSVFDIIIKTYQNYKINFICPELKEIVKSEYKNILLVAYFAVILAVDIKHITINFVELIVMIIIFRKAAIIYGHVKVMEFGLEYENYVKIFDLLFNVIIQAHVFAVLLFSASKINPVNNWVNGIGIQHESVFVKYVNSIYFACTTMLTIGYGDLSPKNVEEKMVTIII